MLKPSTRKLGFSFLLQPGSWFVRFALLTLTAAIVLIHLHFYDWPSSLDMTIYASVGHELLHGRLLYTDMWDLKPPGIYVVYALCEMLVGYGPQMFTVMSIVCATLIMLGIYAAGVASGLGAWAGLLGATLWTLQCGDIPLELHTPNSEYFINVLIVWSFVGILKRINGTAGRWGIVNITNIGICWLMASMFKHSIVIALVPLALVYLAVQYHRQQLRLAVRDVLIWAMIGLLGWLAVFGYFTIQGRFEDIYFTLVTFCQYYGGTVLGNLARHSTYSFMHELTAYFKQFNTLLVLNLLGLLWMTQKHRGPLAWLWLGWLGFAYVAAFSLFNDYEHYLQYLIPVLSLGAGWAIFIYLRYSPRMSRWIVLVCILWFVGSIVHSQLPGFGLNQQQYINASKQRAIDYQARQLGWQLRKQMSPDDFMFVWGYRTDVLFAARCRVTSGVLMANHAVESPYAQKLTDMIFDDLRNYPPKRIVICEDWLKADAMRMEHPITLWIHQHCQRLPISNQYASYSVWEMNSMPKP